MIFLLLLLFLAFLALIILWKYAELKGNIEQRARQIFEEWKEKELESTSARKAEILFEKWKRRHEEEIIKDAVKKSKAVVAGKVAEQIVPFLPEFKYNPKDARFIGSPIDFIVFDGLDGGGSNLNKTVKSLNNELPLACWNA